MKLLLFFCWIWPVDYFFSRELLCGLSWWKWKWLNWVRCSMFHWSRSIRCCSDMLWQVECWFGEIFWVDRCDSFHLFFSALMQWSSAELMIQFSEALAPDVAVWVEFWIWYDLELQYKLWTISWVSGVFDTFVEVVTMADFDVIFSVCWWMGWTVWISSVCIRPDLTSWWAQNFKQGNTSFLYILFFHLSTLPSLFLRVSYDCHLEWYVAWLLYQLISWHSHALEIRSFTAKRRHPSTSYKM